MRLPLVSLVVAFLSLATARGDDQFFREQVAPIFERRCVECHSESSAKGKLSVASAAGLHRGGEGGPSIEPGNADESLLIEKVSGAKPAMPKTGGPLSPGEIAVLKQWIASAI